MAQGTLSYTNTKGNRLEFHCKNKLYFRVLATLEKEFDRLKTKHEIVENSATILITENMKTVFEKHYSKPCWCID